MPNRLSKSKVRISYAEDAQVRKALERLAKKRGVPLSDVIKAATESYLAKHKRSSADAEPIRHGNAGES